MTGSIVTGDSVEVLKTIGSNTVDLVVTSPPYGNLRDYHNGCVYDFDKLCVELVRVLKDGGIIVWNEADETVNNSESGLSFEHALAFKKAGLKLFDTMIYERAGTQFPSTTRYHQMFEYMFILSKGKPNTFNPIKDEPRLWEGSWGKHSTRQKDGSLVQSDSEKDGAAKSGRDDTGKYGWKMRGNIWKYANGFSQGATYKGAHKHPARFPERLARDHIISWSNEGDTVLDPFSGSGTTCLCADILGRKYIGIDISEEYNNIARARIADVESRKKLLKKWDAKPEMMRVEEVKKVHVQVEWW